MFQLIASALAILTIYSTIDSSFWSAAFLAMATVLWVVLARPRRRTIAVPFASRDRPEVPIIR